jgi:hypothetical protein
MGYLIDIFNVVTAAVAVASLVTAVTSAPQDKPWAVKVYNVLNIIALNVGKAKD